MFLCLVTLQYNLTGLDVRELENVLERAVINSSGPKLRLVDELKKSFKDLSTRQKTLEAVECDHIAKVLELSHWKVGGKNSAAEILGLNRSTLRARMRKLKIRKPKSLIPISICPYYLPPITPRRPGKGHIWQTVKYDPFYVAVIDSPGDAFLTNYSLISE
jgi:hypothetical protein